MKATITLTDTNINKVLARHPYAEELQAQNDFDQFTVGASEHSNRYQWDLIAHGETEDYTRRTLYTAAI